MQTAEKEPIVIYRCSECLMLVYDALKIGDSKYLCKKCQEWVYK